MENILEGGQEKNEDSLNSSRRYGEEENRKYDVAQGVGEGEGGV